MVKLLSLWEPWATLMALGAKKIETRDWFLEYCGPLAIQASKGGLTQSELFNTSAEKPFRSALIEAGILHPGMSPRQVADAFPRGKIVAMVNVVDCLPMESYRCLSGVFDDYPELDNPTERAFGNYDAIDQETGRRRYGIVAGGLFRLPEPIPYRAHQGVNTLPQSVIDQIAAQGWKQP